MPPQNGMLNAGSKTGKGDFMRKTKIICTIGPASSNEKTLTEMCMAGMNVARLNFSHGTHEEQQGKIDLIKNVRDCVFEIFSRIYNSKFKQKNSAIMANLATITELSVFILSKKHKTLKKYHS